jgi:hypothetical protein
LSAGEAGICPATAFRIFLENWLSGHNGKSEVAWVPSADFEWLKYLLPQFP